MKALKKIFLILLSVAMIATMIGCSAKEEIIDMDIDSLCNELLDKAEFEDELSAIDDAMIKKLYNIDDYVKAVVYISSGATAEEIAIFEFDSEVAAADGLEKAQVRVEDQKADFESYIPKEIPKLENAVIKQSGKYVIVCVSSGNQAEKIITQYISSQIEE